LLEDAGPPAPLLHHDATASQFPLSLAQERMWVSEKLAAGGAYTTCIAIEGRLDAAVLQQVFDEIVRRHAILRTAFVDAEGPVQVVRPHRRVTLPRLDLRGLAPAARDQEVRRLVDEEARRPFDLARGPLARLMLLELEQERHLSVFSVHHLVFDGWSGRVFCEEMGALYEA